MIWRAQMRKLTSISKAISIQKDKIDSHLKDLINSTTYYNRKKH